MRIASVALLLISLSLYTPLPVPSSDGPEDVDPATPTAAADWLDDRTAHPTEKPPPTLYFGDCDEACDPEAGCTGGCEIDFPDCQVECASSGCFASCMGTAEDPGDPCHGGTSVNCEPTFVPNDLIPIVGTTNRLRPPGQGVQWAIVEYVLHQEMTTPEVDVDTVRASTSGFAQHAEKSMHQQVVDALASAQQGLDVTLPDPDTPGEVQHPLHRATTAMHRL